MWLYRLWNGCKKPPGNSTKSTKPAKVATPSARHPTFQSATLPSVQKQRTVSWEGRIQLSATENVGLPSRWSSHVSPKHNPDKFSKECLFCRRKVCYFKRAAERKENLYHLSPGISRKECKTCSSWEACRGFQQLQLFFPELILKQTWAKKTKKWQLRQIQFLSEDKMNKAKKWCYTK